MKRSEIIHQQTKSDCMLCCICMALGVPYDNAFSALPEKLRELAKDGGWNGADTLEAFELFGGPELTYRPRSFDPGRPAILSVPSKRFRGQDRYHAIYYEGGLVFDPTPNRVIAYTLREALREAKGFWQWEVKANEAGQDGPPDAGVGEAHQQLVEGSEH